MTPKRCCVSKLLCMVFPARNCATPFCASMPTLVLTSAGFSTIPGFGKSGWNHRNGPVRIVRVCTDCLPRAAQHLSGHADRDDRGRGCGALSLQPLFVHGPEAVRRAAPVFFQSLLIPVSIRRFETAEDLRRGRAADFLDTYENQIVARAGGERLASFERRLFDIQRGTREFFRAVRDDGAGAAREEVLSTFGLDPKLPVACFYVPALCGAPHCFGPIPFDDLGDWLRRSLDLALKLPNVNFLVKRHPQDAIFDTSNLVGRFESLYGAASNIRFLSDDIPSDKLAVILDVVVTVSGTPGYDMAVRGVPTIAAGPSRYSGLGFAREPADLDAYETLLRTTGEYKLTPEQRRRALLFACFELGLGRSASLFLPQVRNAGTAAFWEEGDRKLRSHFVEEDPLYRNVKHMLAENLPFSLNTDLVSS